MAEFICSVTIRRHPSKTNQGVVSIRIDTPSGALDPEITSQPMMARLARSPMGAAN